MKTPFDEADKMRGGDNKGKRAFDEGRGSPLTRHPGLEPCPEPGRRAGSTFFSNFGR